MMRQATGRPLTSILNSAARFTFCLFLLTTSLYCLLAYIPFTYHWVVKGELLAWLPVFVKYHPCFFLLTLGFVAPTIARDMQRANTRRLVAGFYVFHIGAGAWFIFQPVLTTLENDISSFKWALMSLTPILWLAAIDFAGHFNRKFQPGEVHQSTHSLTLKRAVLPALLLSAVYAVICFVRFRSMLNFSKTELLLIAVWTSASHLLIFVTLFVAFSIVRILANRFPDQAKAQFVLSRILACLLGGLVIRIFILSVISFEGMLANIYALAMSSVVILLISGLGLRNRQQADSVSQNVVNAATNEPTRRRWRELISWPSTRSLWFIGVIALAYFIPTSVARMDWDFMMQKLSVLGVWVLAMAIWNSMAKAKSTEPMKSLSAIVLAAIAVASFGSYKLMGAAETRLPGILRDGRLNVRATLDEYATYDISFKVAHEVLTNVYDFSFLRYLRNNVGIVPTVNAAGESGVQPNEDNGFYTYLKKNTNLMPSVKVEPVEVNLVKDLKRTHGSKPNIFIFVVDSLRPDYLSPYNNKVSFTPNIDSFARESVVMQNAFTPYGGTVLAEPSIWTGTMQIHKQYVEPFYPMNALQKLIETEDYDQFITMDPVLKIVLKPSSSIIELDKDEPDWKKLDLEGTLKDLREKMETRTDKSRPVFAFTQAQNIHIHQLNRDRTSGPPTSEFDGFDSYYSSQVKLMDAGFGEFIKYLKDTGQYDNSFIVITSDHGDSLGEGGRWGHTTWIFPEILKIPIIVHLPTTFQKSVFWDPTTIAFSSDITPSLYYMLGHRPIIRNDVFGKALFTLTQQEQADYQQRSYLVASSYGPSYGILSNNGQSLFISDASNSKDYFFNLKDDPKGARNLVTGEIRMTNEHLIRRYLDAINSFYNFNTDLTESTTK